MIRSAMRYSCSLTRTYSKKYHLGRINIATLETKFRHNALEVILDERLTFTVWDFGLGPLAFEIGEGEATKAQLVIVAMSCRARRPLTRKSREKEREESPRREMIHRVGNMIAFVRFG